MLGDRRPDLGPKDIQATAAPSPGAIASGALQTGSSQRTRFLVLLLGLLLIGIFGQQLLIQSVLLEDFRELEETQANSSLRLINLWMERFLQPLPLAAAEVAAWPETTAFVTRAEPGVLARRLRALHAGRHAFDTVAVIDLQGEVLFLRSFDAATSAEVFTTPMLTSLLERHVTAWLRSGKSAQTGFIAEPGVLVATASRAVPEAGAPQALVVLARQFPDHELLSLGELGAARVQMVALDDEATHPTVREAYQPDAMRGIHRRWGEGEGLELCRQLSPSLNRGRQLLCVRPLDSVYLKGRNSAEDLRLVGMASFVVMILAAWLFLDQALLRRLVSLARELTRSADSTNALEEKLRDDSRRRDELGLLTGGMGQLLGQIRLTENDLREQEESFRALSESSRVAILVQTDHILYANPFAEILSGYAPQELELRTVPDLLDPGDRERIAERLSKSSVNDESGFESVRGLRKDGSTYWARLHATTIQYRRGSALLVTLYDMSEQRHLQDRLTQAGERQQVILESIQEGIISVGPDGAVDYVNPTAERLIGLRADQAIGRTVTEAVYLSEPDTHKPLKLPALESLAGRETQAQVLASVSTPGGDSRLVEVRVSRLVGGDRPGIMIVLRDVSELRKLAKDLEHQAAHDELTGLINRREFSRRLSTALEHGRRTGRPQALCYIDLDQFKIVNDTCGHHAGDLMLRQIGSVLARRVRNEDTLGRLGGDEFGLLLVDCDADQAVSVANGIRQTISDVRFNWGGRVFSVDASIGIAMLGEVSGGIDEALATADAACFMAKDTGRNRVRLHRTGDSDLEAQFGQMRWAQRLKDAVEKKRLRLYRQSIRPVDGGTDHACEILLRLHEPDGKVIPAGEFLGAAERYQMMYAIDTYVVGGVLDHLRGQLLAGHDPGRFFVNLSGLSLGDDRFRAFMSAELDQNPELSQHLTFEVTETAVISNLGRAKKLMEVLLGKGCAFALDDFGTGMSSFAYLKELDVQYLKIAGPFVRNMRSNPMDQSIVRSFAALARSVDVRTVAEEVENQATLDLLKTLDVDFAQGFFIERPRPLAETADS